MSGCPDEGLLGAFASGDLEPAAAAQVEEHLADCSRCAAAVAMACTGPPAGAEAIPLSPGARVDRYRILGLAGAGAVGLVYAAYDPKLDRKVALKVLRRAEPELEQRLFREARALARVTSLHVVAVHDAGVFDGRLLIAMEYVEGPTLRQWLTERPRSVAEILAVFIQAGRGLAAAHAAGIVHRDFKPDNVLIRPGGQATVTDFGLALAGADPLRDGEGGVSDADVHLTSTGSLVGTPAYMAPEQLRGERADARSDLFAFCVALHAALHGDHPFPTASLRELSDAVQRGVVRARRSPAVPARVRAAVLAGLRPRPEDRPATMDELLAQLDTRSRRTLVAMGALAVVAAGAVVFGAARATRVAEPPCQGAERRLAGVWDGERRAAVRQAIARSGSPIAADAGRAIERALDDYAEGWLAGRVDACQATRVRGEQSEAALDRRMACLDERLLRLGALVRSVEQAGGAQVADAVVAAYGLPAVERCADATSGATTAPTPLVALARATLARASAQGALGDKAGGLRALVPVLAVAAASGDRALEAEGRLAVGMLNADRDVEAAESSLQAGAVAAQAAGRWDLAARAWIQLARRLGAERAPEALRLTEYALASSERTGDALLRADALMSQALVHGLAHRFDQAEPLFRQAMAVVEQKVGAEGQAMVDPIRGLAWVLRLSGKTDEALALVQRAAAISTANLGADHPVTLNMKSQIGCTLAELGRNDAALSVLSEAAAARERVEGRDSLSVAGTLDCLAMVQVNTSANRDAAATYRRSLAIMEQAYGASSTRLVYDLGMLGRALVADGDLAAADEATRRGVTIAETLDDTHLLRAVALLHRGAVLLRAHRCREALPITTSARDRFLAQPTDAGVIDATWAMDTLGRCQRELGRPADAEQTFLRALALREKAYGGKHYSVADALVALAGIHHDLRDDRRAAGEAERAIAMLEETGFSGDLTAEARFRRAQALLSLDPVRARELARTARAELASYPADHPVRREVEGWLAKHP